MEWIMAATKNGTNGIANSLTLKAEQLQEAVVHSPAERIRLLHQLLGEPACRQIGIYPIPRDFKLSVVIPVYNEKQWIGELIRRVRAVPINKEIIVVDDFSTDGT